MNEDVSRILNKVALNTYVMSCYLTTDDLVMSLKRDIRTLAEYIKEKQDLSDVCDEHEYFVLYVDEKCAGTFDTESEAKDASVACNGTIDIVKRNIKWD